MANFPSSVSSNSNLYVAVNGLQTTLAAPITNSQTTITLTSTSGFPTTGYVTIENNEVVSYTGISGADLTGCTRGADGTTALAHSTGVTVGATIVAAHHNLLKDEIIAIETALQAGFTRGNLTAGSSKITVTGGTNAVIGAGTSVDLGSVTLDDLSNVVVPSPSTNDLLAFNGTNWVNVAQPASSLPLTGGTMTGDIIMSNQTGIVLRELTANNVLSTTLRAADNVTSSYTIKFPPALGSGNQALVDVNGDGVLTWATTGGASVQQATYTVGTASGTYTGSTTVFNLPFSYTQNNKNLEVFYNGQRMTPGVDYTETSSTSVTFVSALVVGGSVTLRTLVSATQVTGAVSQFINYVIGTASGTYTGSLTQFDLPFAYQQDGKTLEVFYDGVKLTIADDYTESTTTRVITTQSLVSGRKIQFRSITTAGTAPSATFYREDYVVGTASGNYTGSLTAFALVNSYTPGGTNLTVFLDGDLQTKGASADYLETNSTTVTFTNALVAGQTVTFLFSQLVAAAGTVTTGAAGQMAYYPSTGSTVSAMDIPVSIGRNRWINGEFMIDQPRGGGSVSCSGAGVFGPDGVVADSSGAPGVFSIQRLGASPPANFTNYLRITTTTPDASLAAFDYYRWYYVIEGFLMRDLNFGAANARGLMMSFWIRSSLTGTFSFGMTNPTASRSFIGTYTINSANTWEYKTVQIPGDTTGTWGSVTSGAGAYFFFSLGSGSGYQNTPGSWFSGQGWDTTTGTKLISTNGATLDMTGIQLEAGTVATPFDYRPYGTELALCQRYYEHTYGRDGVPGTATQTGDVYFTGSTDENGSVSAPISFKVEKRTTPSVIFFSTTGASGTWSYRRSGANGTFTPSAAHASSASMDVISQNLGATFVPAWIEGFWVADARLS